ncbi:MAG: aminotransferase class I/II-fold pyridoxal phosphate-dependent enzyme [Planctomycetes bacterium]|nr:aminotransferase class I/II-fold pyridoxal phosphate-dependent enzyme [Planctomycetota bacterium]
MLARSDFRSDTVTQPDAAMREAMAAAVVGDDVFGDDPTVQQLEAHAAALLGKDAALFLPSGTMANQVAVRVHTRPGDEVILHEGCHVYRFEQGGLAALHGVQAVPLPGAAGQVPLAALRGALRPDDQHFPRSRLIVLENTHNLCGGVVLPQTYVTQVRDLADELGLQLHLDGARLANAAAASGSSIASAAAPAHSVTLCLSKGLGAPVGTMLAGSREFCSAARRARKLLGGGMRQAGVLAAAGLVALSDWLPRLQRDHLLARQLAASLATIPGVLVQPPETNLVVLTLESAPQEAVRAFLARAGVLCVGFGPGRLRFAVHRDVSEVDVERAVSALQAAMTTGGA